MNKEDKDRLLFDKIALDYAKKDKVKSTRIARKYQLMNIVKKKLFGADGLGVLVDVACGVGAPATYLLNKYNKYYGIDQSFELINQAKNFNKDLLGVKFIISNIKDLKLNDLDDCMSDTVLAVGALHHMTDLNKVLNSLKNIANSGSCFLGIEPNRSNFFIQFLRWLRAKIDKSYSGDQHYFSKKELNELFERNGFKNIQLTYQGYFSPPFAQVIIKPAWLGVFLSHLAVRLDGFLDEKMPSFLRPLSWSIIIYAEFPKI